MWDGNTIARVPVHTKSNAERKHIALKIGREDFESNEQQHQQRPHVEEGDYRRGTLGTHGIAGFLNAADQPVFSTKHQPKRVVSTVRQHLPPTFHPPAERGMQSSPHHGNADPLLLPTSSADSPTFSPSRHTFRAQAMSSSNIAEAMNYGPSSSSTEEVVLPQISQTRAPGRTAAATPDAKSSGDAILFGGIDPPHVHQQQQQQQRGYASRTPVGRSGGNNNIVSHEEVGLLPFQKNADNNSNHRGVRLQLDPMPVPQPSLPLHLQHVQRSQERRANGGVLASDDSSNMILPFQQQQQPQSTPSKFARRFEQPQQQQQQDVFAHGPKLAPSNNPPSRTDQQFSALVSLVWQNNAEASSSALRFNPSDPFPDMKFTSAATSFGIEVSSPQVAQ
jgi:hypothetical protein